MESNNKWLCNLYCDYPFSDDPFCVFLNNPRINQHLGNHLSTFLQGFPQKIEPRMFCNGVVLYTIFYRKLLKIVQRTVLVWVSYADYKLFPCIMCLFFLIIFPCFKSQKIAKKPITKWFLKLTYIDTIYKIS